MTLSGASVLEIMGRGVANGAPANSTFLSSSPQTSQSLNASYKVEAAEKKKGTTDTFEAPKGVSGESNCAATSPSALDSVLLSSTSPNRKKSRVVGYKQKQPESFYADHSLIDDVAEGSVIASCGSDEDEHSTINPFEEQLEEEDDLSCVEACGEGDTDPTTHQQSTTHYDVVSLERLQQMKEGSERNLTPKMNKDFFGKTIPSLLDEICNSSLEEDDGLDFPKSGVPFLTINNASIQPKDAPCIEESQRKDVAQDHTLQITQGPRDDSNMNNLPPVRENEIEFIIEDFMKIREDFSYPDRLWSPCKKYQSVKFRLLVFPRGNKSVRVSNVSAYMAVDPSDAFPPHFKNLWYMHHCNYMIVALHWGNWKEQSICKNEHFSFSYDDIDRGWLDFVPQEGLVKGQFLGPAGQLILRAQICPRVVAAGNQHVLSRQNVGYIGIRNQGATCYLNSLVQALYHIGDFRRSIFELTKAGDQDFVKNISLKPLSEVVENNETQASLRDVTKGTETTIDDAPWTEAEIREALQDEMPDGLQDTKYKGESSRLKVSLALQELFLKLSSSNDVVSTDDLIKSFGWESNESFTQHDAQELNRLLCDRLEEQMKETPAEGAIERLFMGEFENYVQCIDVPYNSSRRETFYDLQLDVQNTKDIYESLNKYIEEEVLEGDNLYDAENFGRQRARKGVRFIRFPPVIQFHLKRFTFDPNRMDMVKINQRFEYPQTLDLSQILPGAGLYELFSVIVHGGDVGGGHYYLITRPGGKKWWMRFDDEKVYFVSRHSAFDDSYGGRNSVCDDYFKHPNDSRYKSFDMSLRLHSAYILFYVHADHAEKLLEEPDPVKVNPYLLDRIQWDEKNRQKRIDIKNYVRNTVRVRYITEASLRGYRGFFNSLSSLPACYEARFPQAMTVLELWKIIDSQVEKGELSDPLLRDTHEIHQLGIWFFDVAVNRTPSRELEIRPLPSRMSDCSRRESTLGDHLNWIARGLRKPWAPTLCILVHPLFSKTRSEIRFVGALQATLNTTKLFIAKLFSPGSSSDHECAEPYLAVAGIPTRRIIKGSRCSPLVVLFLELLRTLIDSGVTPLFQRKDIELFVKKAISLYIPSNSAPIVHTDPLNVADRVYLEFGGTFEHLSSDNPSAIMESLESTRQYRTDESFPPVIVFALPPTPEALEMHKEAYAYGVPPNDPDIYEEDMEYERKEPMLLCETKSRPVASHSFHVCGLELGEVKLPDSVPHKDIEGTHAGPRTQQQLLTLSEPRADSEKVDTLPLKDSNGALNQTINRAVMAAPKYPPRVPVFPICTPIEWHASLVCSKVKIMLKLYDPIAAVSRFEDASGHPVLPKDGSPDTLGARFTTQSCGVTDHGGSAVENNFDGFNCTFRSTHIARESDKGLNRCPALKEIQVEVDLRWPYRLAYRWLCWHLGLNADYCLVQPVPPLSMMDIPSFTTYFAPSEADYFTSSFTWCVERCRYIPHKAQTSYPLLLTNPLRLEDLHQHFLQRFNVLRHRDMNPVAENACETPIEYHFSILPRRVTDSVLNFVPPDVVRTANPVSPLDDGTRLLLVHVFNSTVQHVGTVLVECHKDTPPLVAPFIQKVKNSITPLMESRGAHKDLAYRLVWEGSVHPDPLAMHQITPSPCRLEIMTDQLLASRFPVLMQLFQYASPLRVEPDFTEEQLREITLSSSLSPMLSLTEQVNYPRPLCLTVIHRNRDRVYFGHPFYVMILSSDTLRTIKEKIKKHLQLPPSEFVNWKFFLFDYEHTFSIHEDEVPDFSHGKPPCLLAVHKYFYAPEEKSRTPQLHIK